MISKTLAALLIYGLSSLTFADSVSVPIDDTVESSIQKLDKINYLPNLLPVIFEYRDFIGLTDEQIAELDKWRSENREPMLAAMKAIAGKRVAIREAALSPTVSSARLQQMQNEIFRLQREVLQYKLACRDHIVRTFDSDNWVNLFMVLADKDLGVSVPVSYAEK